MKHFHFKFIGIFFITITLQSCISGTPDCNDVSTFDLKHDLLIYQMEKLRKSSSSRTDSLRLAYKELGFNAISIRQEKNPLNDSLSKHYYAFAEAENLELNKKLEKLKSIQSQITINDDFELISEGENMSLTSFYCTCSTSFTINEEPRSMSYKLTRHDYDSRTYHEVTFAQD